ncbi:BREX-1 system adenine-specific DNA-methyltransferase PglX [Paraburkholderia sp. JPY432]|uniref:BREX-1 system adenine-specific DNA-methyltransferase PglX n=1 Tax=Paraburkholderia youngii TaxID=2782701 RepID=UPI0015953388|nr:BREX-1 system adenine-specific DNA-methyltransferase PglX [Paraburkholderia youngii]NVH77085.1 BREX-1 system adenine-specific DNA-methyltransferase PglX [Paraburkholderia youngii]
MNKANLKAYAPQARRDFIAAVTARANLLGISAVGAAPASVRGDLVIIEGREWPATVNGQREKLLRRIRRGGFEYAMEEIAYTWFNRFAALRFMELHGYLDHGWRVLSSRDGGVPEILRYASDVSLPGLIKQTARELQLAGTRDNELYKLLLVAQCNDLSRSMPFLFEHIDDETELLLPENLLRTDSIVAKLVESVPEEDWEQIEVVGWLYQFYISEKKDQVIGSVVSTADIPAATQLFTPSWIVQYLVQNTAGRLWIEANPTSSASSEWAYLVQTPEQESDAQSQLEALVSRRVAEDGDRLNPESIKILDPACGSGHILVEAYNVLRAFYIERGYRPRDIPRLILEKNLFGLEIDDRATQLAGFALLMRARADDRRLLEDPPALNIHAITESKGLDVDQVSSALLAFDVDPALVAALRDTFLEAKTFGSLIEVPETLRARLGALRSSLSRALDAGDLYAKAAAEDLLPLCDQASVLAQKYDAVVANPPYLASKAMNASLKSFVEERFPLGKGDTFAAFAIRCRELLKEGGRLSFMTPFTWMFLSSYAGFRGFLVNQLPLTSLVHPEYHSIWDSAAVPICAFSAQRGGSTDGKCVFIDLTGEVGADRQARALRASGVRRGSVLRHEINLNEFSAIPRAPFAYTLSEPAKAAYREGEVLSRFCSPKQGIKTGENERFLRRWHEVSVDRISLPGAESSAADARGGKKWFICTKGGDFRKWYGNYDYVLNWENDGDEIRNFRDENGRQRSRPQNIDWFFREGATWSTITSSHFSMRHFPEGMAFESKGSVCFPLRQFSAFSLLALMNSAAMGKIISAISPTIDYSEGAIGSIPVAHFDFVEADRLGRACVELSKEEWDFAETSWGFRASWVQRHTKGGSLAADWAAWCADRSRLNVKLGELEKQVNDLFAAAYGVSEVEAHASGDENAEVVSSQDLRSKDAEQLVSYIVGCAMGRYSLDEPGLVYAGRSSVGFDGERYKTFPADADGIVPVTEEAWFDDDAANRVIEFVKLKWGADALDVNLAWLAESLGLRGDATPVEWLRRYLCDRFYKSHVQTYKRRPIYWLFSSGKLGALRVLVYAHRYNEATLSRIRSEYAVPLLSKFNARLEMLEKDYASTESVSARIKIQKQIDGLRKKQGELLGYDERLRHFADMRINIDLDDGVKTNYAKFGELVAESKVITGGSDD